MNQNIIHHSRRSGLFTDSMRKNILTKLALWLRNMRTRNQLRELPEHLYQDVGLSRKLVEDELNKPFWR